MKFNFTYGKNNDKNNAEFVYGLETMCHKT